MFVRVVYWMGAPTDEPLAGRETDRMLNRWRCSLVCGLFLRLRMFEWATGDPCVGPAEAWPVEGGS